MRYLLNKMRRCPYCDENYLSLWQKWLTGYFVPVKCKCGIRVEQDWLITALVLNFYILGIPIFVILGYLELGKKGILLAIIPVFIIDFMRIFAMPLQVNKKEKKRRINNY